MPLAIAIFRAQHPEVEMTLAEGEPEEIAPRLYAGEFDLALLFEFEGTSESLVADLLRQPLLEDPMFLALPADHPLSKRQTLRLSDLRAEAWVQTASSSPCARHVVRCCHAAGFDPIVSFESDDFLTVQGLVAAGVGVALIPKLAIATARDDIAIRALSPYSPVRNVIAATPAGSRLTPAAAAMSQIMGTVAQRFAEPGGA
jgi:DNA-binding transcriptional LysR family regulator